MTSSDITSGRAAGRVLARRLGSNFGWNLVSEGVSKGVLLLTTMYLARVLGAEGYGLYTVAQITVFYFWYAVDLGTTMYGVREVAKNKASPSGVTNPLFGLRVVTGFFAFGLLSAFLYFSDLSLEQKVVSAACGVYLVSYGLDTGWVLKGLERFRLIAYGSFASSTAFLAGVLIFVDSESDAMQAALAWSCSFFIGSGILYVVLSRIGVRIRPEFSPRGWFHHLRESVTFTVPGLMMALYRYIPILLISVYFTRYEVGIFSAPYRIISAISAAGFLLPMSFYPVLSDTYANDRAKFRYVHSRFQLVMTCIALPLGLVGYLFAEQIVGVMLGPKYAESVEVFRVLSWMAALSFIRFTYGTTLLATGFQRWQLVNTTIAIMAELALCYTLMEIHPTVGVAAGLLAAEGVLVLVMMVVAGFTFNRERPPNEAAGTP